MLHPQQICTEEINRLLQVGEAQRSTGPLSESRQLAALNRAYSKLNALAQGHEHPDLLDYVNLDLYNDSTGLLDQPFPMRAHSMVALAERLTTIPSREEVNAVITHRRNGTSYYAGSSDITYCTKYEVLMRKFYVRQPRNTTNFRLWYMKDLPSLHYSLVWEDQVSSQNLLYMRTSPTQGKFDFRSDIYIGQLVYIYAGAGIGTMGKIASMERQDSDCYIATCESLDSIESPDTPFTEALDDTSRYTLLPWFPASFYSYLAMEGACFFTMNDGAQLLVPQKEEHKVKFEDFVTPYDPSNTQGIIPNFGSDLGLEY